MTIKPTPSGYVMRCDGDGCDQSRPVATPADVARSTRLGWVKSDPNMKQPLGSVVGHLCPRCAAMQRSHAA